MGKKEKERKDKWKLKRQDINDEMKEQRLSNLAGLKFFSEKNKGTKPTKAKTANPLIGHAANNSKPESKERKYEFLSNFMKKR